MADSTRMGARDQTCKFIGWRLFTESTFSSSLGVPYTARHFAIETANVNETIESIFKPTVTPYQLQKETAVASVKGARMPRKMQTMPPVRRRREEGSRAEAHNGARNDNSALWDLRNTTCEWASSSSPASL